MVILMLLLHYFWTWTAQKKEKNLFTHAFKEGFLDNSNKNMVSKPKSFEERMSYLNLTPHVKVCSSRAFLAMLSAFTMFKKNFSLN